MKINVELNDREVMFLARAFDGYCDDMRQYANPDMAPIVDKIVAEILDLRIKLLGEAT